MADVTWGVEVKEGRERECYYVEFWVKQGDEEQIFALQPDYDTSHSAEFLADLLRMALRRLAGMAAPE